MAALMFGLAMMMMMMMMMGLSHLHS